jgi:hypothetical protein
MSTQSLSMTQAAEQMRNTQLMLQQAGQEMSNQQTQCTAHNEVLGNLDNSEPTAKKGEKGAAQGPVSGEYAFLEAMAGMMETNLSVMGAQSKNMAAMEPQILALNTQLNQLSGDALACEGLSGIASLAQSTALNMNMSIVNAQLSNTTTSGSEDGSNISTMAAENNQNAGLAQSMLQYSFVRQSV